MYDEVVFTGPYHTKQILWPRHAEQNTSGAELHKDLKVNCRNRLFDRNNIHNPFLPNVQNF